MSNNTESKKNHRKKHSPEFRQEALALANKIGVTKAAKELGLHNSQLYDWRSKARLQENQNDADQNLAVENARLKRLVAEKTEEVDILKKAATYFAKSLK